MRPTRWKFLLAASSVILGASISVADAKGGKGKDKDKAAEPAKADPGEIEMDPTSAETKPAADPGEIEMDPTSQPASLEADAAALSSEPEAKAPPRPVTKTPLSWSDIRVVVRKPFLKLKRVELMPMLATTANDNMIRHVGFGGQLNYYITDGLAIGIEGQYFVNQFREPFDLVARQARRLPTVNQYNFAGALNFHYVPVYGKFAILDKHLITWEAIFTAGIGAGQSEVIPRNKAYPGFTNLLIQPNVGVSMRFFLTKWLTVNFGVRDYIFLDKFEPTDRSDTVNATASQAKDNADTSLINNVMFQFGLSFWLPTSFEYTTFR